MKRPRIYLMFLALLAIPAMLNLTSGRIFAAADSTHYLTSNESIPKAFIRRSGRQLVVGENDQPVLLQGVCFGNKVWSKPATPPWDHHNERDYERLQSWHMNAVRFYLNYQLFEDDANPFIYKSSGWEWLDRNISWAKKNHIYLILNMHVPQGGYQSLGDGMGLWRDDKNKERLLALWQAIAERYKDEPTIAAYDLLNEPITPNSLDEWKDLANRLASAIRGVDRNHLLIIERLNGVKNQWPTYKQLNFFLINDSNTAYTFHFYAPIEYTHQNAPWTSFPPAGGYPDDNHVMAPDDATWYTAIFNNPKIKAGNSDWRYYEGSKYQATDPNLLVGKPALVAHTTGKTGVIFFDDFVIKEYDENQHFLRDIATVNIDTADHWNFWSRNGSGRLSLTNAEGHGDRHALRIAGTTDDANGSNNRYRFVVTPGHYYQISGWMKGVDIAANANCQLRIDFESSPSGGRVYSLDKAYLDSVLTQFAKFGEENNVPLYVGEFGLYKECFNNGKGGTEWVRDMIGLLKSHGLNFTYHAYHETAFAIYRNDTGLPDPNQANDPLIEVFKNSL
ncbi:MAG TPA: cellulase family glycosylhydrolase [Bacillota bacterium]|nr:cellulase family glycosylhydrolase [Bacillota bacterium]